jgi:hypothetical protein
MPRPTARETVVAQDVILVTTILSVPLLIVVALVLG